MCQRTNWTATAFICHRQLRRPPSLGPPLRLVSPLLEQLPPPDHLRVLAIRNLDPRRGDTVRAVRAVPPLRDDALEVGRADHFVEVGAAPGDVFDVAHALS